MKALTINDFAAPAVLSLAWPTTESPALREVLRHCLEAFANRPTS